MRWGGLIVLTVCTAPLLAVAQTGINLPQPERYVPRLGDIMNAAQTQHIKLWLAGKSANWELAAYEIRQLKASLAEAALLYQGIPVTNITTMAEPVQAVADAIEAKDASKFRKTYGDLTAGCNTCHRSMGREFIVMRGPEGSSFGNQQFSPASKR